jgi:oligogalacturonide lyase
MRLPLLVCCFAAVSSLGFAADSELGRRSPPERRIIVDRVTGRSLVTLTDAPSHEMKIYQTHPQWASDGVHIIFRSSERNPAKTPQAYAVNGVTGDIVQLTDGPDVDTYSLNVSRHGMRLYFLRGKAAEGPQRLVVLDMAAVLADSAAGTVKEPSAYERQIATLPAEHKGAGGFDIDADESAAYFGVRFEDGPPREPGKPIPQVPSGIAAVDLKTGEYRIVLRTPFLMGHVQVNPWVPGEIVYCNETGGDAPQRIWTVRADGTANRPIFKEADTDWVTHEVVVDRDTLIFNLMGHTPELRKRPTGIMAINLRTDEVTPLGQTGRGQGFWHSHGTPDGRWAAGDNFEGEVFLVDRRTGKIRLVSTGHVMKPDHTHPNFSPDGTRILVQSGMLSGGKSLDLMLIPVPETATE